MRPTIAKRVGAIILSKRINRLADDIIEKLLLDATMYWVMTI